MSAVKTGMKLSLIVCTVGRPVEIKRLFDSLVEQQFPAMEVILVDQSGDDRIATVMRGCTFDFPVQHIRTPRGLSLGRNVGLSLASGEIIAFPDDDCAYPANTISRMMGLFTRNPAADGIGGRSADFDGQPSGPRAPTIPGLITEGNVWRCAISYTIFLRRKVVEAVGRFDEELGAGAGTPFASGEETDYLLRALAHGLHLIYSPELVVFHPIINVPDQRAQIAKDLGYAIGMGRVVRKNGLGLTYFLPHLCKPIAGSVLAAGTLDWIGARRYFNRFLGRWKGFSWPLSSNPS